MPKSDYSSYLCHFTDVICTHSDLKIEKIIHICVPFLKASPGSDERRGGGAGACPEIFKNLAKNRWRPGLPP